VGSFHKLQKPQASTPQANSQTRIVTNAKVRNRYTNLTFTTIGLLGGYELWRLRFLSLSNPYHLNQHRQNRTVVDVDFPSYSKRFRVKFTKNSPTRSFGVVSF